MQWTEYVSNLAKNYKNNRNEYDLLDNLENSLTMDGFSTLGSIIASKLIIVVFNDAVIPPVPIVKGWQRILFNNRWYYIYDHRQYTVNIKEILSKTLEILSNKNNDKYFFDF